MSNYIATVFPIPRWRADPDYYRKGDPLRPAHLAAIMKQNAINAKINASAGDGSYSVILTRGDCS